MKVSTWSKQYKKSAEAAPDLSNPSMEKLLKVLPEQAAIADVDEGEEGSRITHGDFRLDNMVVGIYTVLFLLLNDILLVQ